MNCSRPEKGIMLPRKSGNDSADGVLRNESVMLQEGHYRQRNLWEKQGNPKRKEKVFQFTPVPVTE